MHSRLINFVYPPHIVNHSIRRLRVIVVFFLVGGYQNGRRGAQIESVVLASGTLRARKPRKSGEGGTEAAANSGSRNSNFPPGNLS